MSSPWRWCLVGWQGKLGGIIGGKDKSLDLPSRFEPRLISFLLLTVGAAEIIGGMSFGRLGDRYGMSVVMVVGCALPCVMAIVLVYINFLTGQCWPPPCWGAVMCCPERGLRAGPCLAVVSRMVACTERVRSIFGSGSLCYCPL